MQLYLNPFSPSPWFTEDDVKYIINASLHFGCSQNWLFSDTFRGFAPLVSMSCWRSSIASRWNKWIDVPGCVTLLRWTKIQTVWFDHALALARWLYQTIRTWIRLHKDIKDVFIHFLYFLWCHQRRGSHRRYPWMAVLSLHLRKSTDAGPLEGETFSGVG